MLRNDETAFVIHGLDADNRVVRARVFVQKLGILLAGLQAADKIANGRIGFDYMLSRLENGSAAVTIREKQRRRERPLHSGIAAYEAATVAVYNGERSYDRIPPQLVRNIRNLGKGVSKRFSHAELAFDDNVIRIDDFMNRQSEVAFEIVTFPELASRERFFRGLAIGSFDGLLKEIDARGTVLRGKLVLASGVEIDCVMNKERVPEVRESFDKRVIVDGMAHYDGMSQLPVRLDVRNIKIVKETPDLIRWRGAFERIRSEDAEEEW